MITALAQQQPATAAPGRRPAYTKPIWWVGVIAAVLSIASIVVAFKTGTIVAYGDAESHLNIAKRVIDSLTPGFAQLGGIWLPLPHLLMVPFIWNDFLWRTGLAGSIVSGLCFIASAVFTYKIVYELTEDQVASFMGALVFMVNPNILYMQATPMTELPLIAFFTLSSYYFIKYMNDTSNILMLVAAAFFGFCASLSRYDGWALVLQEGGILFLMFARSRSWRRFEGTLITFATLALFGVAIWFMWDMLILGDPLYFMHSPFSANSQQQSWLARGELPAYGHILTALKYYSYTSMENIGIFATELAVAGCLLYAFSKKAANRLYVLLLLLVPFIFNVATLYLGQSVIFLPDLTPSSYQWDLFNVRYGMMMVPFAAVFIGYLVFRLRHVFFRGLVAAGIALQIAVFALGYAPVLTYADGIHGLSSEIAKVSDAQFWIERHYNGGMVLLDDFSRTISIVHTSIPMQDVIYVGNKPYWEVSLKEPEKYATWIVMQKDDAVWNALYADPTMRGRLFKYFNKVYESQNNLLIFKRIGSP